MAWDDVAGKAAENNGDKYVVLQVVLTEKLLGTGSGTASLTNLQSEINKQAAKSRLFIVQFLIYTRSSMESITMGIPMCLSILHCGALPSSAQYSSSDTILSFSVRRKDVTWNEQLRSFG